MKPEHNPTPTNQQPDGGATSRSTDELAAWVKQVKSHAESKGFGWLIDLNGDYGEMFTDGLTPEEAFDEELDAARQCC